jgi:hypothetical protein
MKPYFSRQAPICKGADWGHRGAFLAVGKEDINPRTGLAICPTLPDRVARSFLESRLLAAPSIRQ